MSLLSQSYAELPKNEDKIIACGVGEASNQGYHGLLAVFVGIRNRNTLNGVYGCNASHIKKEPLRIFKLATKAWRESKYNKIHDGTHWESTNFKTPEWSKRMNVVYKYKNHIFYKERTNK